MKSLFIFCLSSLFTVILPFKDTIAQQHKTKPLIIKEQGSFTIGGTIISNTGTFNINDALNPEGQTLHADHAYVFYQIPSKSKKLPLVFLHGAGQSKKTWESTPDGREGFQNIFLRKNYSVYLVDQPRRASAGRTSVSTIISNTPDEQFWFSQFRLGNYPNYFENVQFSRDEQALAQFYRQMTPNTGPFDIAVVAGSISTLFDKIGNGILITHSQGGGPGWMTAIINPKVKAIIAYEPYSGFVFPPSDTPDPIQSTGLFGALKGETIALIDFQKLTKIPIVIFYGDNIADKPTDVWNKDHWRSGLEMARKFVKVINSYGGDATVIPLPEIGIKGNTHFPFSDLNNLEVAEVLENWLISKNLNRF